MKPTLSAETKPTSLAETKPTLSAATKPTSSVDTKPTSVDKPSDSPENFEKELTISFDGKRFKCPLCTETFTIKANARRHVGRKHKDAQDIIVGKTLCLECNKTFHRTVDMMSHLEKDHNMIFRIESLAFENRKGEFLYFPIFQKVRLFYLIA